MSSVPVQDASHTDAHRFYFIAWRWHFYAGLYVIPFLIMLAVTGLIMLWISALSDIHGERGIVPVSGAPMAVSALQTLAEAAVPGGVAQQYLEPLAADRVAVFKVAAADTATAVVIDPYSGAIVDTFPWRAGWYDFAKDIHGTLLIGDLGDTLIEAAASLGILLVVSGVYLHWPRKAGLRQMLVPDLSLRGRGWWKSLHGAVGIWMSVVMLVFLISGLSWAGVWGERMVQAWNTFPAEKWSAPLSDATHASMNHGAAKEVPWALEQTPLPLSGALVGQRAITAPVDLDSVVGFARTLGFAGRFQLNLPQGADGVWTISHDSMSNDGNDPWRDRTLHIDQYTGNVLADVGYADYSAYARAMAWGIAFHEGDMGAWNIALNTLFCLSMIFLPVSGLVMWWKRRPERALRLAAPPRPRDLPFWKTAAAVVVGLGVLFPLGGALMLGIIVLDRLVVRHVPGLRVALS
ncbi:MAG: PepSY domain-containing protein [Pseudotabrizicola sp.]|uniref:PepSY-associated TM helix domain-containing protein n=1 Tax=Pseudotabrizicola sp. TaxID=2939647 RepID=UPI002724252B|nr:PepSY domain-containing protein [Pseudotabrizicola sp.]MDO9639563.1 PepSY domain-containing protein [Pseudotabrizicola sp.]